MKKHSHVDVHEIIVARGGSVYANLPNPIAVVDGFSIHFVVAGTKHWDDHTPSYGEWLSIKVYKNFYPIMRKALGFAEVELATGIMTLAILPKTVTTRYADKYQHFDPQRHSLEYFLEEVLGEIYNETDQLCKSLNSRPPAGRITKILD